MKLTEIQAKASNPQNSVWVSASAGTGKTHVLIIRFLRLLLNGNSISSILCLTYTKAAAQEMKERVFKHLEEWSLCSESELKEKLLNLGEKDDSTLNAKVSLARGLFRQSLQEMSYIKIQTIHSFCASLLAKFPLEANIPVAFKNLENSNVLVEESLLNLLQQKQNEVESLIKDIDNIANFIEPKFNNKRSLQSILLNANLKHIVANQDYCNKVLENFAKVLLINPSKSINDIKKEYEDTLTSTSLKNSLVEIISYEKDAKKTLAGYIENIKNFCKLENNLKLGNKNLLTKTLLTLSKDEGLRISQKIITKNLEGTGLATALQNLAESLISHEKKLEIYTYYHNLASKIKLALLVNKECEELKFKKAVLSHDDILLKTLSLFKKSDDIMPWVFYKLDSSIAHIMVDEAQDTNPTQWEIIKYLSSNFFTNSSNNNTIFIVGDIKQSIYSFQGANPTHFNSMFVFFKTEFAKIGKELLFLSLNTSFRSASCITSFTELFCNKALDKNLEYYKREDFTHNSFKDIKGSIEVWPILYKLNNKDEEPKEQGVLLAEQIANKIHNLVRKENVAPSDIIVLSATREDDTGRAFYRHLRKLLSFKKIPYKTSDRINIEKSIVVQDFNALACFLSQVLDSYSLATVLKSPIFNLSNQDIFDIQSENKENSLWSNLKANEKYSQVTSVLLALLKEVDVFSPYHIFSNLLYKHGVLQNYISRLGQACVYDIEVFLDLCIEFESLSQGYFLDSFIEFLDESAKRELKQEESQKQNQVVMSTIHYFKGLEAKHVFLISDISKLKKSDDIYLSEYDDFNNNYVFTYDANLLKKYPKIADDFVNIQNTASAEDHRKHYVAITRAVESLYICNYSLKSTLEDEKYLNVFSSQELLDHGFKKQTNTSFNQEDGFKDSTILTISNTCKTNKEPVQNKSLNIESKVIEDIEPSVDTDFINKVFTKQQEPNKQPENQSYSNKFTEIGTHVHNVLELIANSSYEESLEFLNAYLNGFECESDIKNSVKEHVLSVLQSDFYKNMQGFKLFTEATFVTKEQDDSLTIKRTDSFYIKDNNVYIIDYKTSNNNVTKGYKDQLLYYKKQFQSIFPNYNIRCFLFFTKNASVVEIN